MAVFSIQYSQIYFQYSRLESSCLPRAWAGLLLGCQVFVGIIIIILQYYYHHYPMILMVMSLLSTWLNHDCSHQNNQADYFDDNNLFYSQNNFELNGNIYLLCWPHANHKWLIPNSVRFCHGENWKMSWWMIVLIFTHI